MNVISSYKTGIKNIIATLGTSLTENQAKLLKRYVNTGVICYDADRAGVEATYKAAALLRQVGCEVKIANLKDNLDPDDYIQTYGAEAFQNEVIRASETYTSIYMSYLKKNYNLSVKLE